MIATATFEITAHYRTVPAQPMQMRIDARVASLETAEAIVAQFPKSYGAMALKGKDYGVVQLSIKLEANGTHGERNETGIRRYRSFAKKAAALGYTVSFRHDGAVNSYASREALDAAIDA